MLKPAQNYQEAINKFYIDNWYDLDYQYYSLSTGHEFINLPEDNYTKHIFVSLDDSGKVIGLISYNVNYQVMSASSFGAIAFQRWSPIFLADLRQAIEDIFFKYNMNRLGFFAVANNPAVKSYKHFIKRCGGTINGYEHECLRLLDGSICDWISFEIMAKDFKAHYKKRDRKSSI